MARKSPTITSKGLQILLTRIGSASSGTKATLRERLLQDLGISRLRNCHAACNTQDASEWGRKLRLVSIDMGIKNLAFCDTQISYPTGNKLHATMEVLRWEKIDLVQRTRELQKQPVASSTSETQGSASEEEDADPYSLSALSETAYWLIKQRILSGAPDIVLIEKQRWRSGGGSAVQQWTLRVNTLEGMLWAVLATLRAEGVLKNSDLRESMPPTKGVHVYAVDPKRVGTYWLQHARHEQDTRGEGEGKQKQKRSKTLEATEKPGAKKTPRAKAEKKAKIDLLRSWLTATPPSTTKSASSSSRSPAGRPSLSFLLHPSTNPICDALRALNRPKLTPRSRSKAESSLLHDGEDNNVEQVQFKKLDDVTDCFLQAAAWVSWEANRVQLVGMKTQRSDGSETEKGGEEEALLNMISQIGGDLQ